MQRAHGFFAILAVSASAFLVAACASSGGTGTGTGPVDSGVPATNQKPSTVVDAAPPPPVKECVGSCTTDDDCANSCPSVSTGANCCDTNTGECYRESASVCPVHEPDNGGGGGSIY